MPMSVCIVYANGYVKATLEFSELEKVKVHICMMIQGTNGVCTHRRGVQGFLLIRTVRTFSKVRVWETI